MSDKPWAGGDFQVTARSDGGVALCGSCSRTGRCRLGLTKEVLLPDDVAEFEIVCPEDHEGGPGVAHGGWTAAVLDEALGHVPILHGHMAVTGALSVQFVKPVPVGHPLLARAWVEGVDGVKWSVRGELLLASSGAELARGEGLWIERDHMKHFGGFDEWLAAQGSHPVAPGDQVV